ncbi:unnamed protein product [Mytilus edulis]|uniref:Uncharacterized protein n=1 Tax=Mytilus edulis TaxID=6550 RepID=A0A8S3QPA3_MYTED|nr:unnamed protein product [Mytilus edulis]
MPMWSVCAQFCSRLQLCKSINFITSNKSCQIFDAEPGESNYHGKLIESTGNSFVAASTFPEELAGPCKGHGCKLTEVCIPQSPTYTCIPVFVQSFEKSQRRRLHDLDIMAGTSLNNLHLCTHYAGPAELGEHIVLGCQYEEKARYVKLTIRGTEYLHVAEVKVKLVLSTLNNNHDWGVHIEFSVRFRRSSEVKSKERKFHVEMEYDGNNQHKTPLNPCVLNSYDSNGKGYITKSDLEKIFVTFDDGVNTPEILHNLFAELDIDEDNMVTEKELNIMRDDVISEESCKRKKEKDGK